MRFEICRYSMVVTPKGGRWSATAFPGDPAKVRASENYVMASRVSVRVEASFSRLFDRDYRVPLPTWMKAA